MVEPPRSIVRKALAFVGSHGLACLGGLWLPSALAFSAFLLIGRPVACLATGLCPVLAGHRAPGRFELLAWLVLLFVILLPLFAAMQACIWRL
ncbi:MAG TPA: hypothetical protein VH328_06415, partial [Burkholderiaceae bacterium]|nr:hypothetical protein [Burkholderiaceae bacterium]